MRPERAYSPAARGSEAPDPDRVLVIGCGALARELVAVIDQAGLTNVDLTCLPATLHNRPGGIPALVREKIQAARPRYTNIFVAYADCGTGGLLDSMLAEEGVERLPGAHCYEFYAGADAFAAITDEELEKEKGGTGLRYSFDIKRGAVTQEVGVDAQTGKVLENKKEGPHPD